MKRKIIRLMLIGITAMALAGCSIRPNDISNIEEGIQVHDDEDEEPEDEPEEEQAAEEVKPDNGGTVLVRDPMSDTIFVYYPEDDEIKQFNREDLARNVSSNELSIYRLTGEESYNKSILVGEGDGFLFFRDLVTFPGEDKSQYFVYAVREEDFKIYDIWKGTGNSYLSACEFFNGKLYVDYVIGYDESYNSLGDATTSFEYDGSEDKFVEKETNEDIGIIYNVISEADGHLLKTVCSAHVYYDCGYLPSYMDGDLVLVNSKGVKKKIDGFENVYNALFDEKHIFAVVMDYDSGVGKACVYDLETDELTEVSDERGANNLLGRVGTKYYYSVSESEEYGITHNSVYEYDASSGELRFIYDAQTVPGSNIIPGIEGFAVNDSYAYYAGSENGDIFWKTVSLSDPSDDYEYLYFSHDRIFDYGTVSYISSSYECPDCGTALLCDYIEYFILDGSYSDHADDINEYLHDQAKAFIENEADTTLSDSPCEDHQEHPSWYRVTNDYYVSSIDEISDHYLAIEMTGYWYGGGAHGYPYRIQYLFDLTTGEAKNISDFYTGSETDFKTLIAEKTKEDFLSYDPENNGSPYFATDAETVYSDAYNLVSLTSGNMEFTEDGLIYYYPPYDMGPYAAGFMEIFVSYDELLGRNSL